MSFDQLTETLIDHARSAVPKVAYLNKRALAAIQSIREELESEHAVDLGTVVKHSEDGLTASLETPFGPAEAEFKIFLDTRGIYGRYIFYRLGQDALGRSLRTPSVHFDILDSGEIVYEIKDEHRFLVMQPYRHQFFTLALAIVAGLGRNPSAV